MFYVRSLSCLAVLGLLAVALFVGCGEQQSGPPSSGKGSSSPAAAGKDRVPPGLADLSEADREAALKQKICPVTGKELGTMGAPPKVSVQEREVFLCCAGCEDKLRKDPEKYLAKLPTQ